MFQSLINWFRALDDAEAARQKAEEYRIAFVQERAERLKFQELADERWRQLAELRKDLWANTQERARLEGEVRELANLPPAYRLNAMARNTAGRA